MVKDYKGRKSVMAIVRLPRMFHSTIGTILKNKNKVKEGDIGSESLKTARLTTIGKEPMSDMEKFLMTWFEDQT